MIAFFVSHVCAPTDGPRLLVPLSPPASAASKTAATTATKTSAPRSRGTASRARACPAATLIHGLRACAPTIGLSARLSSIPDSIEPAQISAFSKRSAIGKALAELSSALIKSAKVAPRSCSGVSPVEPVARGLVPVIHAAPMVDVVLPPVTVDVAVGIDIEVAAVPVPMRGPVAIGNGGAKHKAEPETVAGPVIGRIGRIGPSAISVKGIISRDVNDLRIRLLDYDGLTHGGDGLIRRRYQLSVGLRQLA